MDDLIATGGTLCAAVQLFEHIAAPVKDVGAIVNLPSSTARGGLSGWGQGVLALRVFRDGVRHPVRAAPHRAFRLLEAIPARRSQAPAIRRSSGPGPSCLHDLLPEC